MKSIQYSSNKRDLQASKLIKSSILNTENISKVYGKFLLFVSFLQSVAIICKNLLDLGKNETQDMFSDVLERFIQVMTLDQIVKIDDSSLRSQDIIALLIIGLIFVVQVITIYYFAKAFITGNQVPNFIRNNYNSLQYSFVTIIIFLVASVIIQILHDTLSKDIISNKQWYHYCLILFGFVILAFSFIQVLIFFLFSPTIKTKDPLSRTNNIFFIIHSIHNLLSLILIFTIDGNKSENQALSAVINLIFSISLTSIAILKPSFYSKQIRRAIIVFCCVISSLSITNFGFWIRSNVGSKQKLTYEAYMVIIMFLVPLLIKLMANYSKTLEQQANVTDKNINYAIIALYKLKKSVMKEKVIDTDLKILKKSLVYDYGSFIEFERLQPQPQTLNDQTLQSPSNQISSKKQFIKFLIDLTNSTHHQRSLFLHTVIANILITEYKEMVNSYNVLTKIKVGRQQKFNNDIQNYGSILNTLIIKQNINHHLQKHQENDKALNLNSYLHYTQQYNKLSKYISKSVNLRTSLYQKLQEENPDLEEIFKIGVSLQDNGKKLESFWYQQEEKQFQDQTQLYKLYAMHQLYVNQKPEEAQKVQVKLNKLITRDLQQNKMQRQVNTTSIQEAAVLLIGAEKHNLGKIIGCSLNCSKFLGYNPKDLLHKPLDHLQPPTIGNSHNSVIRKKLRTTDKDLFQFIQIDSFFLHKEGYLQQSEITVTLFPDVNNGGLRFWGSIRPLTMQSEYMIVGHNSTIEGATREVRELLGIKDIQNVKIKDVCPKYKQSGNSSKDNSFSIVNQESSSGNNMTMHSISAKDLESGFDQTNLKFYKLHSEQIPENALNYDYKVEFKNILGKSYQIIEFIKKVVKPKQEKKYTLQKINTIKVLDEQFDEDDIDEGVIYKKQQSFTKSLQKLDSLQAHFSKKITSIEETQNFDSLHYQTPLSKEQYHLTLTSQNEQHPINEQDAESSSEQTIHNSYNNKLPSDKVSLASVTSTTTQGGLIQVELPKLIMKSKFAKFKEFNFVWFSLFMFLSIFLITSFVNYSTAKRSINDVKNRIELLNVATERQSMLSVLSSRFFYMYYLNAAGFIGQPFATAYYYSFVREADRVYNTTIQTQGLVNLLEKDEQEFFNKKDVFVYNSDFLKIPNIEDKYMVDLFSAIKILTSHLIEFETNYFSQNDALTRAREYIFGNIYNDIWIKSSQIPDFVQEKVALREKDIFNTNKGSFIIGITFLCACYIVICLIAFKSHHDQKEFLRLIINHKINNDIQAFLNDIELFQKSVENNLKIKKRLERAKTFGSSTKESIKSIKNSSSLSHIRKGDDSKLFAKVIQKLSIIALLLIPPGVLMEQSRSEFLKSSKQIMPTVNDIVNLDKMYSLATTVNTKLVLYLMKPQTVFQNQQLNQNIMEDIERMPSTVSTQRGFQNKTTEFLHSNLCANILGNTTNATNCSQIMGGATARGLKESILTTYSFYQDWFNSLLKVPQITQAVQGQYFNDEFGQSVVLFNDYATPKLIEYNNKIAKDLIEELQNGVDNTIKLFYINLVVGFLVLGLIGVLVWKFFWQERKKMAKILNILPINFVVNNRQLRMYMMKQCKQFQGLLKRYQQNILARQQNKVKE